MSNYKINNKEFTHSLNNLLANSKYSTQTNKLFDNLAFPPGLYIQAHIIEKPIYICNNNNCYDCIDDDLHSKLITLVNVSNDDNIKKSSKRNSKKKLSKEKKQKKTKKIHIKSK